MGQIIATILPFFLILEPDRVSGDILAVQFLNYTGDKEIVMVTAGPNPAYTKTAGD